MHEPSPPPPPGGQPADDHRWERRGLSADEVAQRVQEGRVNDVGGAGTRTVEEIVRANVLTRFNALIGGLLLVILLVAPIQDALFGLVAIANTLIGIAQELRAKRTLDRLNVISAPRARVVRDAEQLEIDTAQLVVDDLLLISAGDQLAVDGEVVDAIGLEMNEALVTGESDAVPKLPGAEVLSGSFVAAGSGRVRTTRVGSESFAGRLTEQARQFTLVNSELRGGIDRILEVVTWVLVPTALLLLVTQLLQAQGVRQALAGSVAGTIAIIPEGLVLLTSVAFAAAVVRLGQRSVLVQELPAVETLARVDTVCFDKTGTLTTGQIRLQDLEVLATGHDVDEAAVRDALGALAATELEPNATLRAIAAGCRPPMSWRSTGAVPFSSARKWSAASFDGQGTYVLGAPDILLRAMPEDPALAERVDAAVATGQRVVLLATSRQPLSEARLPDDLRALALVLLAEELRSDAFDTIRFFHDQGVRTLLISGDHPRTVAAVARRVGVLPASEEPRGDVEVAPFEAVDGPHLPEDPGQLAALVADTAVFGRVTPDDKRRLVAALQRNGAVVAMTGDGVNDVLALKDADIGIAMGEGAGATRSVAQLVLLDSDFSSLPDIVAEGRRVIGNIERVTNLFLTKTVYATLLAIAVGVAQLPFPFLPRHLSLVGSLTVGIPAFFLALEPHHRPARPGFLRRAVAFAAPAGLAAGVATFASYWLAQTVEDVGLEAARTTATITLFGLGLLVLRLLSRPMNLLRHTLVYGSGVAFLLALFVPLSREFFALELPPAVVLLAAVGIVAIAGVIMDTVATTLRTGQRLLQEPAVRELLASAGSGGDPGAQAERRG